MEHHLFDLLAGGGVWVLFIAQTTGIFGLPIPDELLLTLAGGLVRQGYLRPSATIAAAVAGSIVGVTFSYVLGRFSTRLMQHLPSFEKIGVVRAESWFRRWGKWTLAFGYFVPGVRHVTAIAAGSARLEFRSFAAYAYPGAALWSTTFVVVGYYASAGRRWQHAALLLRGHFVAIAALLGTLAIIYAFARQRDSASADRKSTAHSR